MQKEEFPTFLNEQPKIIFGRTGRELLIMVCGIVGGYTLWGSANNLIPEVWWRVICLIVCVLLAIGSMIFAMVYVGTRPLEEWVVSWFIYVCIPKIYLFRPLEDDLNDAEHQLHDEKQKQRSSAIDVAAGDLDED